MNSRENAALVFARDYLTEQPGIHYWVSLDVVISYYLYGDLAILPAEQRPYTDAEYSHAIRVLNKIETVYGDREALTDG